MKSESPRRYVSWYKNMFIQISKENTSYTFRNDKEKQAQKCHENQMYWLKLKVKEIPGAGELNKVKAEQLWEAGH